MKTLSLSDISIENPELKEVVHYIKKQDLNVAAIKISEQYPTILSGIWVVQLLMKKLENYQNAN